MPLLGIHLSDMPAGCWYDYYVIHSDEIEKLFRMTRFESNEGMLRFAKKLRKLGIDDELEKMGAKEGDIVKILNFDFEYRK